ncbi:MAG: SpoIIE family protein phosphatase [Acidobacteriota bacterium]
MSPQSIGAWSSRPVLIPVEHGGPRVRVEDQPLRFGRDPSCDVVIPDLTVSRRHARLGWEGDELLIEDLGSSGGTFLNGDRVQRGVVRPGDMFRLGPRIAYRAEAETITSATFALASLDGKDEGPVRQVQAMLEVARALNATTVLEEVLDMVLQAAVRLVHATRGYLVLVQADGSRSEVVAYPRAGSEAGWAARSSVLDRAIREHRTVVVGPLHGPRSQSMVVRGMSSAVAAPLLVTRHPMGSTQEVSFVASSEAIGGILVERQGSDALFSHEDLAVFASLASDAALAIDSARLYREAREKARIEHEMMLARTIQSAFLREPPVVPFAEVYTHSTPARSVGGDLYHAAIRPDGSLAVTVGDVSGKGVSAALIMAMAQGLLGLLHDLGHPFEDVMVAIDRQLGQYNPGNRFLTLACGHLHEDGRLVLANGGHCPIALVRRDGRVDTVEPTGPVLGLLPDASWSTREESMATGDTLVLFSDGITESFSSDGCEFGVEGVSRVLRSSAGSSPDEVAERLLNAAADHRSRREAEDDVTLLVLRYGGPGAMPNPTGRRPLPA